MPSPRTSDRSAAAANLPVGLLLACAACLIAVPGAADAAPSLQQQETAVPADTGDWDVTEPRGEAREIDFTTTEGTGMSVDVAPGGGWLVFDMMGHVYRLPMEGGEAESLTQASGLAWNGHPRISPDGEHIAFVSDRAGQRDLWVMESDGSDPRRVTEDRDLEPGTPAWTPDGRYIVVRRDPMDYEDREAAGIWMYHRDGGSGVRLVGEEVDGAYWPSVSPDGRYVYFHQVSGGDPLNGDYQLRRYDRETGRVLDLTSGDNDGPAAGRVGSGGAYAPEVSPDGRRVAFGRLLMDGTITHRGEEFGPRNSLWIRDLETGAERKVMDPIELLGGELRLMGGYDWTSDGESVVIARGGKLRRLDVSSGEVEAIPFEARVRRTISEQAYNSFRIGDAPFQPQFLRWQTRSPDGRWLAFQAVGQVWVLELPDGEPRRLTPASFDMTEYAPAWSPDGEWLAFTGMDPTGRGHLYRARPGDGQPEQLTERKAFYTKPAWSPDGSEVLVTRGGGATARERTVTHNAFFELVSVPASGGEAGTRVATVQPPSGTSPASYARRAIVGASYGPDGRIYYPEPMEIEGRDDPVMGMVSVARDGSDRRVHMTFPYADEVVPSPEGDWVAFQEGDNAYVVPFPAAGTGGDPVHVDKGGAPPLPVTQVSQEGGLYVRWAADSLLEYGSSNRHYTYRPATGAKDTTRITFSVEKDRPDGTIALTGARIVRPSSGEVIEEGTVVAEDGRLTCVAAAGQCDVSGADRVVDASGKTVIPGLVDMHAHHYREHRGHRPRRDYEVASYLAYGLTTTLDNSMWSENVFPTAERIEAGRMVGPRTYSTGDPLYRGDGPNQNEIDSYSTALDNVRRLKSWGAVSIKQYSHPRRDQRQWIIDASRREGLAVTGHWNPGIVLDGHTGWEHSLDWPVIQRDVAQLYGRADAVYSPTLVVGGHGASNIDWFFQDRDVWKKPKQRDWMPWRMLTFLRERPKRPETDYSWALTVHGVADILEAGGHAAVGGHGEHHPLSPHWNTWMYADVVGEMEALRIATGEGAWFLGADEDIGSLEPGKLADLLVLDSNPLEDIRNTLDIEQVMKNGRLYEASSLDEVWPRQREFGERYWVDPAALVDDARPLEPEEPEE